MAQREMPGRAAQRRPGSKLVPEIDDSGRPVRAVTERTRLARAEDRAGKAEKTRKPGLGGPSR